MTVGLIGVGSMDWWAIVSIVITSALALFFYIRQKTEKHLDYSVEVNAPITSAYSDALPKIMVLVGPTQLEHPGVLQVRIENTGDEPIRVSDYDLPVRISLPTDTTWVAFNVTTSSPEAFSVGASRVNGTTIEIEPALMNPGDYWDVHALTDGLLVDAGIGVRSRIAGIREMRDIASIDDRSMWRRFWLVVLVVTSVLGIGISLPLRSTAGDELPMTVRAAYALLSTCSMFFAVWVVIRASPLIERVAERLLKPTRMRRR